MSLNIDEIIRLSLSEDIGDGDHTSLGIINKDARGSAALYVKEQGVIAGIDLARRIFHTYDPNISIKILLQDGAAVSPGDIAFVVEGSVVSLLSTERLVLNFMQRMSGIATRTATMNEMLKGTRTQLLDTRKTTPLMREIEKMAVKIGGGVNHRFGLYDMILIKDNHIDFAGGVSLAITKTQEYLKNKQLALDIEVEARNMKEIEEILTFNGIKRILLDNFSPTDLKTAVDFIDDRVETEASGKITIDNLREYAQSGVHYISSGSLTHHIKSLDLSLKALK